MAVEVVRSLVVPPSEETRRHGLWLSTLDLLHAKRGHTPTVYLYPRRSADHDFFDVDRLAASLGKALVPFYPLAGRLSVDSDGRPEIDCAGQGVPLVIARSSNLTVDDLSQYQPSLEVKRLFVPGIIEECPSVMCAIQVTFLKCGGVVFGAALHHAIIDGTSACNFYKTWSAFSRSMGMDGNMDVAVELELPCHDHTLLRARSPPPATGAVYPAAAAPTCGPMKGPFIQEIFSISKDQVAALKTAGGVTRSTFCAVSAHVWRCLCIARRLAPGGATQLTFLANFRRSLRPPLPDSYFGNAFIELAVVTKVEEMTASDSAGHLASIAGRVRDAIRGINDEFLRSKLDDLELAAAGGAQRQPGSMPENVVTVVSWLGMPVYHNDFGWGKPQALMLAEQQHAGIVYLIDGANGDGSVNVMCTEAAQTLKDFKRLLHAPYSI